MRHANGCTCASCQGVSNPKKGKKLSAKKKNSNCSHTFNLEDISSFKNKWVK